MFATASVTAANVTAPSISDTSSYREVLGKLDSLWNDKMREIESLSDVSAAMATLALINTYVCPIQCRTTGAGKNFHWHG